MKNEALKYLKDFHGLEPKYGIVEITCEGIADHMVMFALQQQDKEKEAKDRRLGRTVWIIKFGMILFGYLTLSMFQHTINPLDFHWVSTGLFIVWVFIWLKATINKLK